MERKTRQRELLWDLIQAAARPLSPQEMLELAHADMPQMGIATVYRNIKAFQADGRLVAVDVPGKADRYEVAGLKHHHHFYCEKCEKLFDVEGCSGDIERLAPDGFVVKGHQITLTGRCRDCT